MAVRLSLKYKQLRILLAAVGHIPVVAMTIVKNDYSVRFIWAFIKGIGFFPLMVTLHTRLRQWKPWIPDSGKAAGHNVNTYSFN